MKISVVIPLYNKENTIARAVNSVIKQSYTDWELIIVDDGSEDFSVNLVENYNDSRIKLIRQANMGASAARNKGAEEAIGDWIAFLDADDEYDLNFLSRCAEMLMKSGGKDVSFVACSYIRKSPLTKKSKTAFDSMTESGEVNYFKLCKGNRTPVCSSSVVVNKTAFFEVGGFPIGIKYFEDWILWMKLAWYGKFVFIAEPLSYYYLNEAGVSCCDNINDKVFYKCAVTLVETANATVSLNQNRKEMVRDTISYVNSFIMCESSFLARREMYKLVIRLMTKLRLKYFQTCMITKTARIFACIARSGIRKISKSF